MQILKCDACGEAQSFDEQGAHWRKVVSPYERDWDICERCWENKFRPLLDGAYPGSDGSA